MTFTDFQLAYAKKAWAQYDFFFNFTLHMSIKSLQRTRIVESSRTTESRPLH